MSEDKPFIPGDDKPAPAITGGLPLPSDQTARQVDRDAKPRGTTPYKLVLDRADEPVEIRLVRRGYVTQTQKLDRTDNSKLVLVLVLEKEKKRVTRSTRALPPGDSAAKPPTTTGTDDSDDTMNPFAKNKE